MDTLRLAVVGFGARAGLSRHAHLPGHGSAVVTVVEPDPVRAAAARAAYGPDLVVLRDHRELTSEVADAAFVLTPDHTHAAIAIDLLRAGVACYVEKPLAITTQDCDAVLAAGEQTGVRLYVGHNMRHVPVIRTMRDLVAEGAIGAVKAIWCRHFVGHGGDFYFKDWHAQREHTTGLLLQKGAHDIDVIHWLAGAVTRRASAFADLAVYGGIEDRRERPGQSLADFYDPSIWPPARQSGLQPVIDVEDLTLLNLQLSNGVLASYQQCHFTPDYWRNYTVIGDAGRLENFGDTTGAVVKVWNARRSGYRADADLEVAVPAQTSGEGGHGGADPRIVAEFLRFVREGGPTDTSPVAARDAVAAAVAGTRSARQGGIPVDVEPAPTELLSWYAAGQPAGRGQGQVED